jgi:mono/diheme cytochrome c family protein
VFLRYDDDEVTFWITFGRGNTPMPAWGLAGGGPMNVNQVQDVVNYLHTIQQPQQEVANRTTSKVDNALATLAGADDTIAAAILAQEQVVAEIGQAEADAAFIVPLADEAKETLDGGGVGIDTDADGLSDTAEATLSELSREAVEYFRAVEPIQMDPETPDAEKADQAVEALTAAIDTDPILSRYLTAVQGILDDPDEGDDTDGDGIPDADERAISGQMTEAAESTVPGLTIVSLDPANAQTVSDTSDHATATTLVGSLESAAINKRVLHENEDRIRPQEEGGLAFLQESQQNKTWQIDIAGVAEAMGGTAEEAERAVGLFNGYCARCHTAGFSAGIPYTLEAGSGGFGPALWDGRPVVQFGDAPTDPEQTDLLIEFLTRGSEAQKPYGLNGFGSGRMPAFGAILSSDDLKLLARYLRSANMDGMHEVTHVLP